VFDWLFEGRLSVYLVLAVAAAVLLALWWRDRKRRWLYGVAAVGALAGAYWVCDRLVETGREQIARKLPAMARAVGARKPADVLAHVSDQFDWEGLDKKEFGQRLPGWLGRVKGLEVRGIDFRDGRGPQKGKPAEVVFYAKAAGDLNPSGVEVRCEAEFVCDPDGQWRLKGLKVFFPLTAETPTPVRPALGE
jgi:hypothetical protein